MVYRLVPRASLEGASTLGRVTVGAGSERLMTMPQPTGSQEVTSSILVSSTNLRNQRHVRRDHRSNRDTPGAKPYRELFGSE